MKNIFLILVVVASLFMAGCAGYNTVMFTTKSNVGLDVDTKTPTAEITVARKEAVIEPSFEQGKTPPVMASFKPHAGFGSSFQNFFVGVDQTFAGGDSALIMSRLYSKPDGTYDQIKDDSTLVLSEPPKAKGFLTRIPGAGESRPFIFTTDTLLGLKIVWSGTSGQIPDSVKAGFSRKEFAWAPLTMTTRTNDNVTNAYVSIPSFLATIESQIKSDSGKDGTNEISALQYFATGGAARQLALKQDVRVAMLARLDPNAKNEKAKFGKVFSQAGDVGLGAQIVLVHIYNGLKQMADANDQQAKAHVEALDNLGTLAQSLTYYTFADGTTTVTNKTLPSPTLPPKFKDFIIYQSKLKGSINILSNSLAQPSFSYQPTDAPNPIQVTPGSSEANQLKVILDLLQKLSDTLATQVHDNAPAAAAINFYCNQLTQ